MPEDVTVCLLKIEDFVPRKFAPPSGAAMAEGLCAAASAYSHDQRVNMQPARRALG